MGEIAAKEIVPINLEEELKESYLNYAMHVIVGRALPDARDGLKPVHRRILYAMHVMNNDWNKPPKKSMRIVGDVTGKYHPHGDTAAYETIVRMGQWWSLRYMLIDKQGNFGSMDGDPPAAARYTEARMSKIAHELLEDLDKETVKFVENYDGQETMPDVLPTRIPNLLINGSSGIAVGMATNMAPHNLDESISACLAFINNPEISLDELIKLIPGPDFPTGGIINGKSGIRNAYETGKGKVKLRAKTSIEGEEEGKPRIVVSEIPYMVNKARLVENIAHLMRDKKIEGIKEIRDESDKDDPVRIVIELRAGAIADVVLNNLFKQLKNSEATKAIEIENKIWKIWSTHPSNDRRGYRLTELLAQGSLLMTRKELNRAYEIFSQIILVDPNWSEAWNKRATVLYLLGRYQQSQKDIDEVLKLEKRHFGALSGQGLVQTELKNYEKAINSYKEVQKIYPAMQAPKVMIPRLKELIKGEST